MKKIIDGKVYNTDTAKEICQKIIRANMGSNLATAFDTLYQKRTGEFFLSHQTTGQSLWDSRDYITPISKAKAKDFAVQNMDADDYMAVFGNIEEMTLEALETMKSQLSEELKVLERMMEEKTHYETKSAEVTPAKKKARKL